MRGSSAVKLNAATIVELRADGFGCLSAVGRSPGALASVTSRSEQSSVPSHMHNHVILLGRTLG